ncbi:MAG: winged helix-turn-helix domain-containing protein [Rubrivivax sp.]|nr:winged helix-turn-helix domain-containing protein [Rubrivivax sp.]
MSSDTRAAVRLDGGRARLDIAKRQLVVAGEPVRLGGRAFDVLLALFRHRDRLVPKQELLDLVWPGLVVEENTLQVHVAALRRALGAQAISTVSGRGYCWTLPVDDDAAPPADDTVAESVPPREAAGTLLGRQALLHEVARRLANDGVRLLTLSGPGGTGKTRVALHATAQAAALLRDGAYLVTLAPLRDGAHLMSAVAAALGLQESSAQPAAELVRQFVKHRQLLLTLDNLEHLPQSAPQLQALLDAAPQLKLLVTSRRPTHLAVEHELRVPPLALPESDAPERVRASPAVQLFAQRAREQGRALADDGEAWRAAAAVCRRLDGLPLAIELAAARLRVLTPALLAARLQQALPLLTSGPADAPDRHRTLRAAIDWSHALLDPAQQRLFRRLAVFAGGWTLEGAEAVDDEPAGVVDRLEALLDIHLVQRIDDVEGEPRYTMLETLREFALEQLAAAGEEAATRERHARHALRRAVEGAPQVASAGRRAWLARLRADLNNLRAALDWWLRRQPDGAAALQLAAALAWVWYFEGLYAEGRAWIAEALALAPPQPDEPAALRAARAELLSGAARLAAYSGDKVAAFASAEASVALWRSLADPRGLAFARFHEGIAGIIAMQLPRARAALAEALDNFRAIGDGWGIALATSYLGTAYAVEPGCEDQARPLLLEGRVRFKSLADTWGLTVSSHYLGSIALRTGDLQGARGLTQEMLVDARELGDRYRIARNLHQLAEIDLAEGRWRDAVPRLAESLQLNAEQRRLGDAALQLRLLTRLAQEAGAPETALRFAALAAQHAGGERTMPPDDPAPHEARVAALQAALPPARRLELELEGRALSIDAAAAAARALLG